MLHVIVQADASWNCIWKREQRLKWTMDKSAIPCVIKPNAHHSKLAYRKVRQRIKYICSNLAGAMGL